MKIMNIYIILLQKKNISFNNINLLQFSLNWNVKEFIKFLFKKVHYQIYRIFFFKIMKNEINNKNFLKL